MIKEKVRIIEKFNTFNSSWSLFLPCVTSFKQIENDVEAEDRVVDRIAEANKIVIIISNFFITRKIMVELIWVSKYADITVITKTKELLDKFSNIKIKNPKVDSSVSFDYMSITNGLGGKSSYLLDGLCEVDDTLERAYFSSGASTSDISIIQGANSVIVVGKGDSYTNEVIDYCKMENIPIQVVVDAGEFNKSFFDKMCKENIDFFVSDNVIDGVYFVKNYNELFKLSKIGCTYIGIPSTDIKSLLSNKIYKSLKLTTNNADFPKGAYTVIDGAITKLDIAETNIIEIPLDMPTMKDYIEENFDSSEAEEHNKYAGIAKCTQYKYILNPPCYDSRTFKPSSLYSDINSLTDEWDKWYNSIEIKDAIADASDFDKENIIVPIMEDLVNANHYITRSIKKLNLADFKTTIALYREKISSHLSNLYKNIKHIGSVLISKEFIDKINVFNNEINKKHELISRIEAQMVDGQTLASNVVRINNLKKEIDRTEELRNKFIERNEKQQENDIVAFIQMHITAHTEHSAKMLKVEQKEEKKTALELFGSFIERYYTPLKDCISNVIDIMKNIEAQDLSEAYTIYDYDGKRYIAINNITEYETTAQLCKKYNAQCVAAR